MKTALVTGASGGIGYQVALKLAIENVQVFAVSRNKKGLTALMQNVAGNKVIPIVSDITTEVGLANIANVVASHSQKIHILINNAAQLVNKHFKDTARADFHQLMKVNFVAPAMLIKECLPFLRNAEGAHIINIGSMAGVEGSIKFAGLSAYSASKAALANLSELLAEELRSDNIIVNCLALGAVQTNMIKVAIPNIQKAQTVDGVADYIAWFAINGNRYFNGKVLQVATNTP